jgi:hypothetical protein
MKIFFSRKKAQNAQMNSENTNCAAMNPNGIPSSSPGLRGTSYLGFAEQQNITLKGLNPCAPTADATPLGLENILDGYPG